MKLIGVVCMSLLVTACFGREQTIPVDRAIPEFSRPTPVEQRSYNWVVINRDNINEVLAQLEASGQEPVLFAVTPEGYQAIILNSAELRRFITQQTAVVDAQQQYLLGLENNDN